MKLHATARLIATQLRAAIGDAPTNGIQMSQRLQDALRKERVDERIIFALEVAMAYSGVDTYAKSYAHGMERAYAEHGLDGVHFQVLYLLNNMSKWKGDQARLTKQILKKWKLPSTA